MAEGSVAILKRTTPYTTYMNNEDNNKETHLHHENPLEAYN
jgi:hypothetical protein